MSLYFTSDQHFGHENIIRFCGRPFASVEEQTEVLVDNFNKKVGPKAVTFHLGDLFWKTLTVEEAKRILKRLNGRHAFIRGNHDELIDNSRELRDEFTDVQDIHVIKHNKKKIILCHYSMNVWPHSHKGSWHLFGHSHGELEGKGLSFDVGVDGVAKYSPMSIEEVAQEMSKRECSHVIPVEKRWPGKTFDYDHLPEGSH